jgi:hypothetical protein
MPLRRTPFIAVLCVAVVLTGKAFAHPAGDGWKTYRIKNAGISLDLPSSWVAAPYARFIPQPGSSMEKKYPEMTDVMKLAMKNKLVKFFAFARAGQPADINVIKITNGPSGNFSNGLAAQLTSALIQSGIDPNAIHERRVKLPAGTADRVTLPITLFNVKMEAIEYLFTRGDSAVEVTLVAPASQLAAYQPTFDLIANSIRYL